MRNEMIVIFIYSLDKTQFCTAASFQTMSKKVSPYFKTVGSVMSKKSPIKIQYSPENPPEGWRMMYDNILKMREDRTAPVDSMGCERSHDPAAPPAVQRFQCLVSLMLSSQTRDEVNYAAMMRLRRHGLTVENVLNTDQKELEKLIHPVGFWRNKAKYIKQTCKILHEKYDNDIPDNVEELCELPGVGPKMAYLTMNIAWEKPTGIGVDTHVHRIVGRLGWTTPDTCKTAEQTRKSLEAWLPLDRWIEINWLLVGFGQQICVPVGPKCGECLNRSLCPVGQKWTPSPRKKSPKKRLKVDADN